MTTAQLSFRLSPTARTSVTRGRDRVVDRRARLNAFLAQRLVAHLGIVVGDHPLVVPAAYGLDLEGPDRDGTLYIHGSVAAGWLRRAMGAAVCVTVTELDGLVAGRSAFHHSMNYRSAVVIGQAREVTDPTERQHALDLIVDQMIPGRSSTLRPSTRKELAATAVLAISLHEASMKERFGDPVDEPLDIEAGVWGGYIPLRRVSDGPVTSADSHDRVPTDVSRAAAAFQ